MIENTEKITEPINPVNDRTGHSKQSIATLLMKINIIRDLCAAKGSVLDRSQQKILYQETINSRSDGKFPLNLETTIVKKLRWIAKIYLFEKENYVAICLFDDIVGRADREHNLTGDD